MFAVVRIRGSIKVNKEVKYTLTLLKLKNVNNCALVKDNDAMRGCLQKIKDYVTFGEVDEKVFEKLVAKWGRLSGKKRLTPEAAKKIDVKSILEGKTRLQDHGVKPFFRLHPPKKGYEGVKTPFTMGGALGYRGKEINELLERMI